MNIPKEIVDLALEAQSEYNDGWAKKYYTNRLIEIREFIDRVLTPTHKGKV